jgi:hypothetical protein
MINKKVVIRLTFFLLFLSLVVTFLKYLNDDKSNISVWDYVLSYTNQLVTILNLFAFLWFSIEVFRYNTSRDIQNEQFEETIERPILILKSIKADTESGEKWILHNIGNGAALNLRVAEAKSRGDDWGKPVIKCYSLGKGENIALGWLVFSDIICVIYEDIFENLYVSLTADDESYIRPISRRYKDIVIAGRRFIKKDFDLIIKTNAMRYHKLEQK